MKDLHTIVLLDSEETHTYKHIGREAIRSAINHRQIATEQYSRTQCSAVIHGINWRLVFYYKRYLQQPFSLSCSDLKSWCARIFHSAAILSLQRLGIPLPSIIRILDTIQCISHKVRTEYGDSNLIYGRDAILE